jgi:hypothetical protein
MAPSARLKYLRAHVAPVVAREFALDFAAFLNGEHADHGEGRAVGIADDAVD